MLLSVGIGLTLTVTLCVLLHPFAVMEKIYTTSIGLAVVFIRVSFGFVDWAEVTAGLLIPATAALVQVIDAPPVALVGV